MITDQKLDALEAAALSWRGTPFCEGSAVKGGGVSCSYLMAELLFEAELTPRIAVPSGPSNWRGQSRSLIEEWVEQSGLFVRIGGEAIGAELARLAQPADLLGFRVVNAIHHLMAQLRGGRVVHAIHGHGVVIAPAIPYEWGRRLERVWRLKEHA